MTKKLLILLGITSMLSAGCVKSSNEDEARYNAALLTQCFNVTDEDEKSISTKILQKDFTLDVEKHIICIGQNISNKKFRLIDNKTDTIIKDKDGNEIEGEEDDGKVTFKNIPKTYKDVTVLISYTTSSLGDSSDHNETSTDTFAIRPYEFNITLRKKSLKIGESTPLYLEVIDYKNNIVQDYSESSINLEANTTDNIPVQYSFDIKNGKSLPSAIIQFLKAKNNISVIFRDKNFASIDADDTIDSCLDINGTVEGIDVTKNYKSWAGSSTENSSNNPKNKTINSKIKQNQNRDLHFQKMGW